MSTVVVLVKHVPDTWSKKTLKADHTLNRGETDSIIDEVNEYAVEQALRVKEAGQEGDIRVVAATMGPVESDEALRKALAMGADDAVRLTDDALAGSDAIATAWALKHLIESIGDVQLVVAGSSSSDGETGLVVGLLAEYLQRPALTSLTELTFDGATVRGVRQDVNGTWQLEANAPALASVTDRADKPRYPNFKRMKAAKAHEITVRDLASIGVNPAQVGIDNSSTRVTSSAARPERTAGEIIDGSDPHKAAQQIVDYLESRNLL